MSANQARRAEEEAVIARQTAEAASVEAQQQAVVAQQAKANAENERQTALDERAKAQEQAQIARSRQLAFQAIDLLSKDQYEAGLVLTIEAGLASDSQEAFSAIRTALAHTWHTKRILYGHTGSVIQATWSQDESKVLTANYDGTARIWEAATGKELVKLEGHTSYVYQATWSQDASKVLTTSYDRTARIWEAATGKELVKLEGHTDSVNQATWSQDEGRVLTASADGTVRVWPTHMSNLIAAGCRLAPRNLTWNEWNRYMETTYRPTCPQALLPPDVLTGIQSTVRELVRRGNLDTVRQQLDELKQWLPQSNQPTAYRVELITFIAQAGQIVTEQAGELARSGEITLALAAYEQALMLDPTLPIIPEVEIKRVLIEHAGTLAHRGEITQAVAVYEQALLIDPTLPITPAVEAKRLAVQGLLDYADAAELVFAFDDAADFLKAAQALEPTLVLTDRIESLEQMLPPTLTPTLTVTPQLTLSPTPSKSSPGMSPLATPSPRQPPSPLSTPPLANAFANAAVACMALTKTACSDEPTTGQCLARGCRQPVAPIVACAALTSKPQISVDRHRQCHAR